MEYDYESDALAAKRNIHCRHRYNDLCEGLSEYPEEPKDKAQPAVSTEPSPDLIALQQKLEAASAREAVLKGKLESEQAAREVAEDSSQSCSCVAATSSQKYFTHIQTIGMRNT